MEEKRLIKDYLYKVVCYNDGTTKFMLFPYSFESSTNYSIDSSSKEEGKRTFSIFFINLDKTVENDIPILDSFVCNDITEFIKNLTIIDENDEKLLQILEYISEIIIEDIQETARRSLVLSKIINSIGYMFKNSNKGTVIIDNETSDITNIVLNAIDGKGLELKDDDIDKIYKVIVDVINQNLDIDVSDQKSVDRLKAEIEYKIIDAIPPSTRIGSLNINMQTILEEINKRNLEQEEDE